MDKNYELHPFVYIVMMAVLAYGLSYFELGSVDPKSDQKIVLNNAVFMA